LNARFFNAALIVVDVQNDFCPGGALPVPDGDQVVAVINRLLPLFPLVVAGMDWHPADHCSFRAQGGPWPPHCVQGTFGAELHPGLDYHRMTHIVRKASRRDRESYSEFDGRDEQGRSLKELLARSRVQTLYLTGLATDYCVRATALDARQRGYDVFVITDAVRAVNVKPGDGEQALREMAVAGARLVTSQEVVASDGEEGC